MPSYKVKIEIKFKSGVLDPQGETIKNALLNLNYSGIQSVTTGKMFKVNLEAKTAKEAITTAKSLADKLLANPVIEDYTAEIDK